MEAGDALRSCVADTRRPCPSPWASEPAPCAGKGRRWVRVEGGGGTAVAPGDRRVVARRGGKQRCRGDRLTSLVTAALGSQQMDLAGRASGPYQPTSTSVSSWTPFYRESCLLSRHRARFGAKTSRGRRRSSWHVPIQQQSSAIHVPMHLFHSLVPGSLLRPSSKLRGWQLPGW